MLYLRFLSSGASRPGNGKTADSLLREFSAKYPNPTAIHTAVITTAISAAVCVLPPPMKPSQTTATSITTLAAKPAIGMTYLVRIERRSRAKATMAIMHVTP